MLMMMAMVMMVVIKRQQAHSQKKHIKTRKEKRTNCENKQK